MSAQPTKKTGASVQATPRQQRTNGKPSTPEKDPSSTGKPKAGSAVSLAARNMPTAAPKGGAARSVPAASPPGPAASRPGPFASSARPVTGSRAPAVGGVKKTFTADGKEKGEGKGKLEAPVDVAAEEAEPEPEDFMTALSRLPNRNLSQNAILKQMKHRVIPRVLQPPDQPIDVSSLVGARHAIVVLQGFCRMCTAKNESRRRRLVRMLRPESRSSSLAELTPTMVKDNPVFKQMVIRMKINPMKTQEDAQAAALHLQTALRRCFAIDIIRRKMLATWHLQTSIRTHRVRPPFRTHYTTTLLAAYLQRRVARDAYVSGYYAVCRLQAGSRRRTLAAVRRARYLWAQSMFNAGYRAHKMTLIRLIRTRREAIKVLQGAVRRTFDSQEYCAMVTEERQLAREFSLRQACGLLLSTYARMALANSAMVDFAARALLLRNVVRGRFAREQYIDKLLACQTLHKHFRAVVEQQNRSLKLIMPLTRHSQGYRESQRAAARLQAWARLWCMETVGQESAVEVADTRGRMRLHLSLRTKQDAAKEMQRMIRRALAFTDNRTVQPSGYSAILLATAQLHGYVHAHIIDVIMRNLVREYAIQLLQGNSRMMLSRLKHRRQVAAYLRVAFSMKRMLTNRWFILTFDAQKVLQGFARWQSTPKPDLEFSRMPTRKLAMLFQARLRMTLARMSHAECRDAALTIEAIVKMKVYRIMYLNCKIWCNKVGGSDFDLQKLFGSLIITMHKKGTPFWRKSAFLDRRHHRSVLYGTTDGEDDEDERGARPQSEVLSIANATAGRASTKASSGVIFLADLTVGVSSSPLSTAVSETGMAPTQNLRDESARTSSTDNLHVDAEHGTAMLTDGSTVGSNTGGTPLQAIAPSTLDVTGSGLERSGGKGFRRKRHVTVAGLSMTEKKRSQLGEEHRRQVLKAQEESSVLARKAGLAVMLNVPVGSQRVQLEGRLAKVISDCVVVLDRVGASTVEDAYRHFFLTNGRQSRRIIKYTSDCIASVAPPFSRRPVEHSRFTIIDLEEAPFEPNLVKLRREKERASAIVIQSRWRSRLAEANYNRLCELRNERLRVIAEEERAQEELRQERERVRRKQADDTRMRIRAIEEGKRLLAEAKALHDAQVREQREAKRRQRERLYALKPIIPVLPSRWQKRSPSPRAGQNLQPQTEDVPTSTSPLRPSPPPKKKRDLEKEARAAQLKLLEQAIPSPDRLIRFLGRPAAVLPPVIANRTIRLVLKEEERWSREQSREPSPIPHRPQSARRESDNSDARAALVYSPVHMRQRVERRMKELFVDLSPPKMDPKTSAALEELVDMERLGKINKKEFERRKKNLLKDWKLSPETSPRTGDRIKDWDSRIKVENVIS